MIKSTLKPARSLFEEQPTFHQPWRYEQHFNRLVRGRELSTKAPKPKPDQLSTKAPKLSTKAPKLPTKAPELPTKAPKPKPDHHLQNHDATEDLLPIFSMYTSRTRAMELVRAHERETNSTFDLVYTTRYDVCPCGPLPWELTLRRHDLLPPGQVHLLERAEYLRAPGVRGITVIRSLGGSGKTQGTFLNAAAPRMFDGMGFLGTASAIYELHRHMLSHSLEWWNQVCITRLVWGDSANLFLLKFVVC